MNKFDEMKQELVKKAPHINTLPFFARLYARFIAQETGENSLEVVDSVGTFRSFAVTVQVKGRDYTKRFGRLGS